MWVFKKKVDFMKRFPELRQYSTALVPEEIRRIASREGTKVGSTTIAMR
jgi:hypothetical protein